MRSESIAATETEAAQNAPLGQPPELEDGCVPIDGTSGSTSVEEDVPPEQEKQLSPAAVKKVVEQVMLRDPSLTAVEAEAQVFSWVDKFQGGADVTYQGNRYRVDHVREDMMHGAKALIANRTDMESTISVGLHEMKLAADEPTFELSLADCAGNTAALAGIRLSDTAVMIAEQLDRAEWTGGGPAEPNSATRRVFFAELELQIGGLAGSSMTLAAHGVEHDSVLTVSVHEPRSYYTAELLDIANNKIEVRGANLVDTVAEFKLKVQKVNGMEPDTQRLVLGQKVLEVETRTLKDYDVERNSQLLIQAQNADEARARRKQRAEAKAKADAEKAAAEELAYQHANNRCKLLLTLFLLGVIVRLGLATTLWSDGAIVWGGGVASVALAAVACGGYVRLAASNPRHFRLAEEEDLLCFCGKMWLIFVGVVALGCVLQSTFCAESTGIVVESPAGYQCSPHVCDKGYEACRNESCTAISQTEQSCSCRAWAHTRKGKDWTSGSPTPASTCAECAALCSQDSGCAAIECQGQDTTGETHCLRWKAGTCDTDASADMFMVDGHQTCRPDASTTATSRVWTLNWGERFHIRDHYEGDQTGTPTSDAYDSRNGATSGTGHPNTDHNLRLRRCGVLSWVFGSVVPLVAIAVGTTSICADTYCGYRPIRKTVADRLAAKDDTREFYEEAVKPDSSYTTETVAAIAVGTTSRLAKVQRELREMQA